MSQIIRPPQFRYVRRARRIAFVTLTAATVGFVTLSLAAALLESRDAGEGYAERAAIALLLGAGTCLAGAGWLRIAKRWSHPRAGHEAPELGCMPFDEVPLVNAPLGRTPVRILSRLPLLTRLFAPRLVLDEDALILKWRFGLRSVPWSSVVGADWRPDAVVLQVRGSDPLTLRTCRLPTAWGPDDDLLKHAVMGSAFAGAAYNERIAAAITSRVAERKSAYRDAGP